ncbi:MAG: hypothetical protein GY820_29545 [Gammaproteobacteria bacterium]|nr:hypothetical protein [Gammaproteobacteria bacterium]
MTFPQFSEYMTMQPLFSTLKLGRFIPIILISLLASCGGGSSDSEGYVDEPLRDLTVDRQLDGIIGTVGDVDWYHFKPSQALLDSGTELLSVLVKSNTIRPDVDLLVTVFQQHADGTRQRLAADHATEQSVRPADISIVFDIDANSDFYISVRDLKDNEASDNKYFITLTTDIGQGVNGGFQDAIPLTVDSPEGCHGDQIDFIGDQDLMVFEVTQKGIYKVATDFTPFIGGTDVQLTIKLFGSDSTRLDLQTHSSNNFAFLHSLAVGIYYILVSESGADHADLSSSYKTCVTEVKGQENQENDNKGDVQQVTESSDGSFDLDGVLSYTGDADWYSFTSPDASSGNIQLLDLKLYDLDTSSVTTNLLIEIMDSSNEVIFSHSLNAASPDFNQLIKASDSGDHWMKISPLTSSTFSAQFNYIADISFTESSDVAETTDGGNESISAADSLSETSTDDSGWTEGYISYVGDIDWYKVDVPPSDDLTTYRVVELYFESDISTIDYRVAVFQADLIKDLFDTNGSNEPTRLKTSWIVPPSDTTTTYSFKVVDFQSNEGNQDIPYRIRTNVRNIPDSIPADSSITGDITYHDENVEQGLSTKVYMDAEGVVIDGDYGYDDATLIFDASDGTSVTDPYDNTATITQIVLPWVAGYIDYQDDRDFFRMKIDPLQVGDLNWHYEMKVQLHVGAPGSDVEYAWKLYIDPNNDEKVFDRATANINSEGFFAGTGDDSSEDTSGYDIYFPNPNVPRSRETVFWIGDAFEAPYRPYKDLDGTFTHDAPSDYYFSVSDLDYGGAGQDNDWSGAEGDIPYYFQITLLYRPIPEPIDFYPDPD